MLKKSLSGLLILAILATIAGIVWLAVVPQKGDSFSEFYLLGLDGKADNYPTSLKVGETGAVIAGIVNREHQEISYQLLVKAGDTTLNKVEPIILANEQKWEKPVSFVLSSKGENQRVDFVLYKNGQPAPYLTLNLLINVK